MLIRKFNQLERLQFVLLASVIRDKWDRELGELLLRVADGDDSVMPQVHERFAVIGDFEGAERIRKLMEGCSDEN